MLRQLCSNAMALLWHRASVCRLLDHPQIRVCGFEPEKRAPVWYTDLVLKSRVHCCLQDTLDPPPVEAIVARAFRARCALVADGAACASRGCACIRHRVVIACCARYGNHEWCRVACHCGTEGTLEYDITIAHLCTPGRFRR